MFEGAFTVTDGNKKGFKSVFSIVAEHLLQISYIVVKNRLLNEVFVMLSDLPDVVEK
jgi:hypothetical protein